MKAREVELFDDTEAKQEIGGGVRRLLGGGSGEKVLKLSGGG
jgi:hypothetical protein